MKTLKFGVNPKSFVVRAGKTRIFGGAPLAPITLETVAMPFGAEAIAIELGAGDAPDHALYVRHEIKEGGRLPPKIIQPADMLRLIVRAGAHDVTCHPVVTGRSRLIPHDGTFAMTLRPVPQEEKDFRLSITAGIVNEFRIRPPFHARATRVRMRAEAPEAVMIERLEMSNVTFVDGPVPCGRFFGEGLDVRTYILTPANSFGVRCTAEKDTWLEVDLDLEPVLTEADAERVRNIDPSIPSP